MMETFVTKTLELTDSRVVIERLDPDELPAREEPPTVLRHSWLVRPFALLVTGYGVPRYREIEPTLIVAVSYFLMYGMMFGDVGQGAVLVVIGLAVRWLARREFEKDFGMLLALCGVSAIIFGFIYGSVFGKEGVIEPLWLSPVGEKVGLLLAVSVTAGVAFISLGVIFNVFNQVHVGNWVGATCDRFGVAGLVFYWGVLGLLLKYFVTGTINAGVAALIIAVPLLVLMFKEPVRFALRRARSNGTAHGGEPDEAAGHEGPGNFFEAAVEGLMEVFEAPLLFTSNTISFMRLGAYAMGHAGLCVVIFSLAKALSSLAGGTVWAVLMIVVGNILVIGLEGLVVAVQALRLEYYEFFSKFYSGDGWAYRPFDLKGEES
jgi:V/A-type H+-transporting ATPase subunit I